MATILFFHGGDSYGDEGAYIEAIKNREVRYEDFSRVRWISTIEPSTGIRVLAPQMPGKDNARYDLWSIVADKALASIGGEYILIGASLGGAFLLKYLAENRDLKPQSVHLVAPAFFPRFTRTSRPDGREPHASWYIDDVHIQVLRSLQTRVHVYHSEDDVVVLPDSVRQLLLLAPNFYAHWFIDRGHFNGPVFPEIIESIKKAD